MELPVAGVILLFPKQFLVCSKCNHPHLSHFHLYSTWEQVYEVQLSVDDNMRKQWEAAKDEKERTEALLATSKIALEDLSHTVDEAMIELVRLAEEYMSLSLSGSFSAPLEKAVWLLETAVQGNRGERSWFGAHEGEAGPSQKDQGGAGCRAAT